MLFSIAGGKFHKAVETVAAKPWRPTLTKCGMTVTPLNYFADETAAENHTGGRLKLFMCKHCAAR